MSKLDEQTLLSNGVTPQKQSEQPGVEKEMDPIPIYELETHVGSGKLKGKVALITGGDSGIGKAVAIGYAKEGADIAIAYLNEQEDAENTKKRIEQEGVKCTLHAGDVADEAFCNQLVEDVIQQHGKLNILVNNAARQEVKNSVLEISAEQLKRTFDVNFFSMVYLTKAAIPHLSVGDSLIYTASINAYVGNKALIDYTSTKGAIVSFTRSIAQELASKGIRVNGVAPGPIWTPLIPATMTTDLQESFGVSTPLGRPGQPADLVEPYILLASEGSAYMTGQFIHVNGGQYMSS
ncbi:short chain dehydrogenase [Niallia circulans]|uniref:SDR family oxidoreductase n=1 Tax=Niallia TaxID=2837506 RepID=UPI00077C2686|nr:SDR family oxidoreductase [Niallia circulans]MED3840344.1 SDR family oxidoreductase [Niallia circulans]MED4242032.1 SDR family oxidoreductase [Niallia circulans]MED4249535.1 SDR family oxidoreductase [Niallia circulans]SPT83995.1 short chain dehydrogenase [Niallia circulans]